MKINVGNDLYLKGRIGWKGLSKDEFIGIMDLIEYIKKNTNKNVIGGNNKKNKGGNNKKSNKRQNKQPRKNKSLKRKN